jgi:hypothetical protein
MKGEPIFRDLSISGSICETGLESIRCICQNKRPSKLRDNDMYIRLDGDDHLLVRTVQGIDGAPEEAVLANLGQDPELNLFIEAENGRRDNPEAWEGVSDFHLLQALENFKRRLGSYKPALVMIKGRAQSSDDDKET